MSCIRGLKNCEVCNKKFNPWLTNNEKIVDFIRWKELAWLIGTLIVSILIFGWFGGIIVALILDWLNHLEGGPVIDIMNHYPKEEYPKQTCSENIEDCPICHNEYDHFFNLEYEKHLKWYEKII